MLRDKISLQHIIELVQKINLLQENSQYVDQKKTLEETKVILLVVLEELTSQQDNTHDDISPETLFKVIEVIARLTEFLTEIDTSDIFNGLL
jgi:hypothetical protein